MKYGIYTIVIVILTGLQIGLLTNLKLLGSAPSILLLFVIGVCLQRDSSDSFFVAFLSGLFLDFTAGMLPGAYGLAFLFLALSLYFVIYRLVVFELSWKYLFIVVASGTVFVELLAFALTLFGHKIGWSATVIDSRLLRWHIAVELVSNLILAYPLYALSTWLNRLILVLQGKKYRVG